MRTLTDKSGNPAHALREAYQELMALECRDTLAARALKIVLGGPGISAKNAAIFRRTVEREQSLHRLQSYLTNFMLKADGLGVI